jgi:superfamily I DNA and/or RNA helicase
MRVFLMITLAAQLVEAESLIILQYEGIRHLVLAGDDKQLPATVFSMECIEAGYSKSLFERLKQAGIPSYLLNEQYRMHPAISRWPSSRFYSGDLLDSAYAVERPGILI